MKSNEELMQSLLTLDSITCGTAARPMRKDLVTKIQGLITDVDSIGKKKKKRVAS